MGQMADIRASTARMWEEHASGEDLVALCRPPATGTPFWWSPNTRPPVMSTVRPLFASMKGAF